MQYTTVQAQLRCGKNARLGGILQTHLTLGASAVELVRSQVLFTEEIDRRAQREGEERIPRRAGIQSGAALHSLDARLRGHDGLGLACAGTTRYAHATAMDALIVHRCVNCEISGQALERVTDSQALLDVHLVGA